MTSEIKIKAKELAELVLNSEEYQNYIKDREILKAEKTLYDKVNEFRRQNYLLQIEGEEETLYDEINKLENDFSEIRQDSRVDDFLKSELSLCKMIQKINHIIMEEIDFELDFF